MRKRGTGTKTIDIDLTDCTAPACVSPAAVIAQPCILQAACIVETPLNVPAFK